jgi:hypothetical protein
MEQSSCSVVTDQALGTWFQSLTGMMQGGEHATPSQAMYWGRLLGAMLEEFAFLQLMLRDTSGELVFGCDVCQKLPRSVHNDAAQKYVGFQGVAEAGFKKVGSQICNRHVRLDVRLTAHEAMWAQDEVGAGWYVLNHERYVALVALLEEARALYFKRAKSAEKAESTQWPPCSNWKAANASTPAAGRSHDKRVTFGYDAVVCPVSFC